MELWIRSQNGLRLVKVNGDITITHSLDPNYHKYQMYVGITYIGEYKTEERALEVLDEIQKIILLKEMYINDRQEVLKAWTKLTEEQIGNIRDKMSTYKMPKE